MIIDDFEKNWEDGEKKEIEFYENIILNITVIQLNSVKLEILFDVLNHCLITLEIIDIQMDNLKFSLIELGSEKGIILIRLPNKNINEFSQDEINGKEELFKFFVTCKKYFVAQNANNVQSFLNKFFGKTMVIALEDGDIDLNRIKTRYGEPKITFKIDKDLLIQAIPSEEPLKESFVIYQSFQLISLLLTQLKFIAISNEKFTPVDVFSYYLLRQTKGFHYSKLIQTNDHDIIEQADAVCGIGGIYKPDEYRFDHHYSNRSYLKTPLSSCGLIYISLGNEINRNILKKNGITPDNNQYFNENTFFKKIYLNVIQEIDAHDRCIPQYSKTLNYDVYVTLTNKIEMMNEIGTFEQALEDVQNFYEFYVLNIYNSFLVLKYSEMAYTSRYKYDKSGQIIVCEQEIKLNFFSFENREKEKNPRVKSVLFTVYPRIAEWHIAAVRKFNSFECRKPLPFAGLKEEELSNACGIKGGIFVHKNAFVAAFKTRESAIQFAKYALHYKQENRNYRRKKK